jgi:hypothetical protein
MQPDTLKNNNFYNMLTFKDKLSSNGTIITRAF